MADQVLLCRRAIEPRRGLWTLPAGFLENGETLAAGAVRETLEEANARVAIGPLYTIISLPHISQVYMMFRARLLDLDFGPGPESLEVRLFDEDEIPWEELAFRTIGRTLRNYFLDRKLGAFGCTSAPSSARRPGPISRARAERCAGADSPSAGTTDDRSPSSVAARSRALASSLQRSCQHRRVVRGERRAREPQLGVSGSRLPRPPSVAQDGAGRRLHAGADALHARLDQDERVAVEPIAFFPARLLDRVLPRERELPGRGSVARTTPATSEADRIHGDRGAAQARPRPGAPRLRYRCQRDERQRPARIRLRRSAGSRSDQQRAAAVATTRSSQLSGPRR